MSCEHQQIQLCPSKDGTKSFKTCLDCGCVLTVRNTWLGQFTDGVWRQPKKGWPKSGIRKGGL